MKSCRILLIALFTFFFVSVDSQVFVGGNFGLNTTGGSTSNGNTTTDKVSSFTFDFSPKVGKFLSEKVAAGAGLNISFNRTKTPGNTEIISRSSTFGIVPFLRYYAIKSDKFSVFGQGNAGLLFSDSFTKIGSITTDGPRATTFYLNLVPGLAFDVNDKLSLETSLNIFSFGYYNITSKDGSSKDKTSTFGMGAGLDDIVTVGNISVGAIYKF